MRLATVVLLTAAVLPSLAQYGPARPRHGGVAFSSGPLDIEFVLLKPSGYQVYFLDGTGEELPASTASGVTVAATHATGPAEKVAMKVDDSGETWISTGTVSPAPITAAKLSWTFRGQPQTADVPFNTIYHAELQTKTAKAGEPVQIGFLVRDFFGKSLHTLQIEHEKPMHLMVVSRDLSEFWHIHPQVTANNVWQVSHA